MSRRPYTRSDVLEDLRLIAADLIENCGVLGQAFFAVALALIFLVLTFLAFVLDELHIAAWRAWQWAARKF